MILKFFQDAVRYYEKYLESSASRCDGYFELAQLYYHGKQYQKAEDANTVR